MNKHGYPQGKIASADSQRHPLIMIRLIAIIWICFNVGIPKFIGEKYWPSIKVHTRKYVFKKSSISMNKHGYPQDKMASAYSQGHSMINIRSIFTIWSRFDVGIPTFVGANMNFHCKFLVERRDKIFFNHNE